MSLLLLLIVFMGFFWNLRDKARNISEEEDFTTQEEQNATPYVVGKANNLWLRHTL